MVKQAGEVLSNRTVAIGLILAGVFVELVMPLGILTGVADRLAAFIMAGCCAVTTILFKRFWQPGDFWKRAKAREGISFGTSSRTFPWRRAFCWSPSELTATLGKAS